MKTQLVGSAPSKEQLLDLIGKYFLINNDKFILREDLKNEGLFTVWFPENSIKAGKQLNNFIVRLKKNRYRFERIIK